MNFFSKFVNFCLRLNYNSGFEEICTEVRFILHILSRQFIMKILLSKIKVINLLKKYIKYVPSK
jgi:hypothetical protein